MESIIFEKEINELPLDLRIECETSTSKVSIRVAKDFQLNYKFLGCEGSLDKFLKDLPYKEICTEIITFHDDSAFIKKSFSHIYSGQTLVLHTRSLKKLESKTVIIDIEVINANDLGIVVKNGAIKSDLQHLCYLLDPIKEAIVIIDGRSGYIKYVNQSALRLVGLNHQDVYDKIFTILFDPKFDRTFFDEKNKGLFESGQAVYKNVKLRNHASIKKDATIKVEVVKIGAYKYAYARIFENRISEYLSDEPEFYHFKALFDDSLMGSILVDLNGYIYDTNNAFSDITGYKKTELDEFDLNSLSYNIFDKKTADNITRSFEGLEKINNEETLILTKEGDWKWCRLSSSIIHDRNSQAIFFIVTIENINDAKLTELKYQSSRDLLTALSSNLNECIYRSSIDDGIVFANKAFIEKFGYSDFEEIENIIPSSFYANEKVRWDVVKEIKVKEKIVAREIEFKKRDGSRFWGLLNCSLFIDDEGKSFIDGVITDISKQKETEKLLKQNNSDLKKINSEMDKFVYSVSHDLRAPLMSMLGLLRLSMDENKQESLVDYLSLMERSVYKLDGFIKDIIDFSRNVRTDLSEDLIDFKNLIDEVWSNLEYIPESSKIDLQISIEPIRPFKSDIKRLSMILSNLLSNAIRYQNYSQENPRIHIRVFETEQQLNLIVADNGPGIPKEYQKKIFDMFFRISSEKNGSGLGLYIVKETVEKIGGKIELSSSTMIGSSFKITFAY